MNTPPSGTPDSRRKTALGCGCLAILVLVAAAIVTPLIIAAWRTALGG